MEVVIQPDAEAVARLVADAVERLVHADPEAVLGLATGSTPLPTYAELVRRHRTGTGPSYRDVTVFTLDEYVGLEPGHPEGYRAVIEREITGLLDVDPANVHSPDPDPDRLPTAGDRYEEAIREAGGVDLQIAGIGSDGHLAFNEPGSSLSSRTRMKTLTELTRQDNARFFASIDEVPHHVLTQGLGTILRARHVVMIATGEGKADAVAQAVEGPVSAACPASVMQLHEHATVLVDDAAASRLQRRGYYTEVFAMKPEWQTI